MRWLLWLSLVSCGREMARPEPVRIESATPELAEPQQGSEPAARAEALLVGVLHKGGTRVCDAGRPPEEGRWVDLHPVIGFVPLIAGQGVSRSAAKLYGGPVVATGSVREGRPDLLPPNTERCHHEMQMRSDWVETVAGIRIKRREPPLPAFSATSLTPFQGLRAERSGSSVRIRFDNRLGRALRPPVVLRLHYEGCYGKPGSTEREHRAERGLPAGAALEAELPAFEELADRPEGRRRHAASWISIEATGDRVWFDFDVDLGDVGASVSCKE
jgi:hypothetical protein